MPTRFTAFVRRRVRVYWRADRLAHREPRYSPSIITTPRHHVLCSRRPRNRYPVPTALSSFPLSSSGFYPLPTPAYPYPPPANSPHRMLTMLVDATDLGRRHHSGGHPPPQMTSVGISGVLIIDPLGHCAPDLRFDQLGGPGLYARAGREPGRGHLSAATHALPQSDTGFTADPARRRRRHRACTEVPDCLGSGFCNSAQGRGRAHQPQLGLELDERDGPTRVRHADATDGVSARTRRDPYCGTHIVPHPRRTVHSWASIPTTPDQARGSEYWRAIVGPRGVLAAQPGPLSPPSVRTPHLLGSTASLPATPDSRGAGSTPRRIRG